MRGFTTAAASAARQFSSRVVKIPEGLILAGGRPEDLVASLQAMGQSKVVIGINVSDPENPGPSAVQVLEEMQRVNDKSMRRDWTSASQFALLNAVERRLAEKNPNISPELINHWLEATKAGMGEDSNWMNITNILGNFSSHRIAGKGISPVSLDEGQEVAPGAKPKVTESEALKEKERYMGPGLGGTGC